MTITTKRLVGLDLARFLAFIGMVIVNFKIAMGATGAGRLGGQTLAQSATASTLFCLAATVYSFVWSRYFKRGPIEALMRRLAG